MKYLPTVNLWNPAIASAIETGQMKLQCGQWVKCGTDKLSRFVCKAGNSLWVAHWQGNSKDTKLRFQNLLRAAKASKYVKCYENRH